MLTFEHVLQQLTSRDSLPPLFPERVWNAELSRQVQTVADDELFGHERTAMTDCGRAGLLLLNDDLEASHGLVQDLETPTASFWHAILHRREGDAANSRYWWRKTGTHPAFDAVFDAATALLNLETEAAAREFLQALEQAKRWLPEKFVACCEASRRNQSDDGENDGGENDGGWLRRVQLAEMTALLNWCRHEAR